MSEDGQPPWPPPPEGIAEAIFDAARVAGLGVSVTAADPQRIEPVWFNQAAVRILGRSFDELMRTSPLDLLVPEDRDPVMRSKEARDRGVRGHGDYEVTVQHPDGTRVPIQVSLGMMQSGGRRLAITFFRDVSEQRAIEGALRESEARFRRLVEAAPDGVAICRPDGLIIYANPATARAMGFASPDEMLGANIATLYMPEELPVLAERFPRMLAGERFPARLYRLRRRDGTPIVMEMSGELIDFDGGPAILGVGRDVTEREEMQRQLARADRLAALGMLAAGVAHEINNPLTFVSLGLQALERKLEALPDPQVRDELIALLAPMRGGTERVADIVRDLRAFARDGHEPAGDIEVVRVLASAERMAAHELRHRARLVRRVRGEPRVRGHAGRLEQVVLNLLVNAMQAFDDHARDPQVIVSCEEQGGFVELAVEDNAGGIPEEIRARVFDPFFTTKPADVGTGLGLWICHGIVTSMGGTIALDSTLGRGTVVRVRLPSAASEPAPEHAREVAAPSAELRRLRVLVVDDEPTLGRLIKLLLTGEHEIESVTSAAQALARIEEDPELDVVLCDVMMPRTSGPELHEQVAARWPELGTRFVFMTGGALTERARDYLDRSPLPLLEKPFSPEVLRSALRRASGPLAPARRVRTSRS